MPTVSGQDRVILRTIQRWKQTAAYAIDDIDGWRNAAPDNRYPHFSESDARTADDFFAETQYLVGIIVNRFAKLDPTPVTRVCACVEAWYHDHGASRIPPQVELVETLDQAMIVVNALEVGVRAGKEDVPELDGPEAPNRFNWKGKSIDLSPQLWALANCVWPEKRSKLEDVASTLWENDDGNVYDKRIREVASKLTNALSDNDIAIRFRVKAGFVTMELPAAT